MLVRLCLGILLGLACTLTAAPAAAAPSYEGLWRASGGFEAGWGINFAHQGDVVFATWFT